jgi:hypothetical protein
VRELDSGMRLEVWERTTEWIIEITSYQRPDQLIVSLHSFAMDIRGMLIFDPVDGRTRLRWVWELNPQGIFKLTTPFIKRSGQRLEEQNWENLKIFLEDSVSVQS